MFEICENVCTVIFLGICCYQDLKSYTIPVFLLPVFFVTSGILKLLFCRGFTVNIIWGLLPGIILFGISKLSKEAIGEGDCYLFLYLGFVTGAQSVFLVMTIAFFLAAGYALYLIFVKKLDKQTRFAFAPFIFMAHLLLFSALLFHRGAFQI